jgi:hypothetical protein
MKFETREALLAEYLLAHTVFKMEERLNSDLKPGDQVGWFTTATNKRATWRGEILCLFTPVLIESGKVIGFEPRVEFRAPSWKASTFLPASEVRKRGVRGYKS